MNEKVDFRSTGVVPPAGLTVLFEPQESSLDIVFIHGFTGDPARTWTHKKGDKRHQSERSKNCEMDEPPLKVRKLNPFSSSHHGDSFNTPVYWPQDLVPTTVPFARVLTYGYDTHLRHMFGPPVSQNTVYDIAWDFLVALEAERRLESSRPILFIAHSLGGIIVKEMLRRSSGCHTGQVHLHRVFDSTTGIIFFGTPHGGADPRGFLQHIAEAVIKAAGVRVNKQVVETLLPSSERLRELRDEFGPLAQQQEWIIHSFQEGLGVMGLNGQKAVEDTSSYLNFPAIEVSEHIGYNHMDMCRFRGLDDPEYKKVAAALHRVASRITKPTDNKYIHLLSDDEKLLLVNSLKFDQIDARQVTIKRAHAKTCQWLLKKSEYLKWLSREKLHEHLGFLWIKGKPGTGKSTIMKFAVSNARKKMKDGIILSFFFNARGADLEKSTVGMYRSLLVQLFERLPDLQSAFVYLGLKLKTWINPIRSEGREWSLELLKDLFEQAIQRLGDSPVMCFIDALDECEEAQIRDMVSFFQQLGGSSVSAGIRFQVCVSSRHYPQITIKQGLGLVLEGQEGHTQDIASYIDSELAIGHSKLAKEIRLQLQHKTEGVFMWVVLVVGILNKEHDGGRIHALRKKLQDIPSDLHELFRDILTRDCNNSDELLLCIQWVLFAKLPLDPKELYFAILAGTCSQVLCKWDPDEISVDAIERFIINSSKGLAEITKSKSPTVQFIHESVRDFLLKENGLRAVWPDLGSDFRGQSHDRLKQSCINYMKIGSIPTHLHTSSPLHKASSKEATDLRQSAMTLFPFLHYAVQNILYHTDMAEGAGVSQKTFLHTFPLSTWIQLDNIFQKFATRRHTLDAPLLYILAENNMSNLIRICPFNTSCFDISNERYGPPIFAARATGSDQAIQAFLKIQAQAEPQTTPLHDLCRQQSQNITRRGNFERDFTFSRKKAILSYVIERGDDLLLACLLSTGKFDPIEQNSDGLTPLCLAASAGQEVIIKLLLKTGVCPPESDDRSGRTPLSHAAAKGHIGAARLLLDTGQCSPDSLDEFGLTPLSWAVRQGQEAVVRLLLGRKCKADHRDNGGRTQLWIAVECGHEGVVKLLLETQDVDINTKDNDGTPLLFSAVSKGNEAVVKLLLDAPGIDINSKDKNGQTSLWRAAERGREGIIRLLIGMEGVESLGDVHGRTPLLVAATNGHEAVVRLLLAMGKLDANSNDHNGRSPLLWAAANGHEAVVESLLGTEEIALNTKDIRGLTTLSWAAAGGKETIVALLLAIQAVEVNTQDKYGRTPLLLAIGKPHLYIFPGLSMSPLQDYQMQLMLLEEQNKKRRMIASRLEAPVLGIVKKGGPYDNIVKLLLERGANANLKDFKGETPLSLAAERHDEPIIELLLNTGQVEVDAKDDDGYTPLAWAVMGGNEAIVQLLLATGQVDVNSKDNDGQTPLSRAIKSDHKTIMQLLESVK